MSPQPRPGETLLDRFWKLSYARHSFEHAKAACDYIIENKLTTNDELYYPLIVAIHVTYARPFGRSEGRIARLKESVVPAERRFLHKQMIRCRNQVLAHTDSAKATHRGLPANQVQVHRKRGGLVNLAVQDIKPKAERIPDVRDLCAALILGITQSLKQLGEDRELIESLPKMAGGYWLDLANQQFVPLPAD